MKNLSGWSWFLCLLSLSLPTQLLGEPAENPGQPIVNGLSTLEFPSTVALLDSDYQTFCTGTLIGCSTVLTAAHCLCNGLGLDCQADGPLLTPAETIQVFAQHGGFRGVTQIDIPDHYEFGATGDLALLHLAAPYSGIQPMPINQAQTPTAGATGEIIGFGSVEGINETGGGIKRRGSVVTTSCLGEVPEPDHVCWLFNEPPSPPGVASNTCSGDSGGPLLVDLGDGPVLAGVTSGGVQSSCLAPDISFDANVFFERDWILDHAQSPLGQDSCGGLPSAGDLVVPVSGSEGDLTGVITFAFAFQVPPTTNRLRIAMNGESEAGFNANDFDLLVNFATPPENDLTDDCRSRRPGTNEFCEFSDPSPGNWWISPRRVDGGGDYQITITQFQAAATECVPDSDTACLLDGKFRVEGTMNNFESPPVSFPIRVMDFSGSGRAESDQAVFFESFNPGNFEAGVKMVDACSLPEGHPQRAFWAFFGALSNAETNLRITDTLGLGTYEWSNPPGTFPQSIGDTQAFPCFDAQTLAPPITPCERDADTACLLDGRFEVTGDMRDFAEPPRTYPVRVMTFPQGRAESEQAAFFESFSLGNFEVGVKMVDACTLPEGHPQRAYWAFYGGLTNAETTLTITQVASGATDQWHNPPGDFPFSEGRTQAFPCE